ncbi:50S ribosomal protein L22 [Gammaproteobacteria bacterium]|nr:50S ribosomal protein L22 [Gammaproteobacteria bacterium]
MQVRAITKSVRMSPQKVRLVADQIRNKPVEQALEFLEFSTKKAALPVKKTLESAIANAEHNESLDIDYLHVSEVQIDAGPTLKRFRPRAKGRAGKILKRTSHIMISVAEK